MPFLRFLLLLLFFCGSVQAEHRVFTRKDGFLSMRDKLNVYFFQSDTHRLLVRDEGSVRAPRYGSLDKAMRKSPCSAGVNGGFFGADAEGTPLGLVVQDGKRLSPLATGSFAVSGVVYDTGKNGLFLIRSSALKRMKKLPAMQAAFREGLSWWRTAQPSRGSTPGNPPTAPSSPRTEASGGASAYPPPSP